jgi:hypothetical protein
MIINRTVPTSLQETLLTPAPVAPMRRQSHLPTPPHQQQQHQHLQQQQHQGLGREPTVAELMELERTREALQLAAALDDMTLSDPKKFSIPPPGYVCKLWCVFLHSCLFVEGKLIA